MAQNSKPKPIRIMDTTLRDGHQSLIATRLRTEDMLPIAVKIDQVGYAAVEMWGGATFDTAIRYLKEDPWERIRRLKKLMPRTPFQMLLRGQNLVGYRHYPDDVVERFIERAISNGINILRIFDALNDFRNLKMAIKATLKYGGKVEGTFCYTLSPVHNNDLFVEMAKRLEDMGSDSICVKDMAGLLSPYAAFDLIGKMKKAVTVPIHLHSHDTSAMALSTYLKAIEAGIDIIDTAISSMASGTSQPPVEAIVNILRGGKHDPQFDLNLLAEIADYFRETRKKYKEFESDYTGVDPHVLIYQIPGGMTSNLAMQLSQQNALDRMKEVLEEVPRVREDFGYPPLVTPTSQIVGTQATLNVLTGERYKVITTETKNYLKGLYGKPSAPINEAVRKRAIGEEETITRRPADLLEPEIARAQEELKEKGKTIEDVITYALFPKVALEFFEKKEEAITRKGADPKASESGSEPSAPTPLLAPSEFNVKVHGETFHVKVGGMGHPGEGGRPYFLYIDGQLEEVMVESLLEVVPSAEGRIDAKAGGRSTRPKAAHEGDVTTPMPGAVVAVKVKLGDPVKAGQTVLVVEAMKMQSEVHTPISGVVKAIYVSEGDRVNPDEALVEVRSSEGTI
ncbi:MAG TPA: sodium-extruding oxaloacetate decarboxylase subunit alpha [Candidatus Manganitrophaceae bacterium]|nr:sodium-extruding oxaloacetate decarboxylase subunit alpha [Candidatus Manganitrophaceae bacterium]